MNPRSRCQRSVSLIAPIVVFVQLFVVTAGRQPVNPHEVYVGETQIGKSTTLVQRNREDLSDSETSVVCIGSQPESTAFAMYAEAVALGQAHRTVLEDFDDFQHVVPRDWLPRSTLPGWEGTMEDKRTIELRMDALSRRRGFTHLDEHPLIREYGEPAHRLMLKQEPRKPLATVEHAFLPGSPGHRALLRDCLHEDVANVFASLPMHPSTLDRLVGPAKRFMDIYFRSPALAVRDNPGGGDVLRELLDRGFHYFIQGGRKITQEEWRFICATVALEVIRYKETGGRRRVVLNIEESEANDLVRRFEARAMQLLGKTGLAIRVVAQEPFWHTPETTEVVMQNSNHLWMRSASAAVAQRAAEDLAGAIDPYAVKHIEYLVRQYQVGWETVPVETETKLHRGGTNQSISLRDRPVFHYELAPRPTHFQPHEQLALLKKWNMTIARGEAFVKCDGRVSFVRFPEPRASIDEESVWRFYEEHRKQWPFSPVPGSDPTQPSTGEAATTPRSVSFVIRRRVGNRSAEDSTPLTRWQTDEQRNSVDESAEDT
jgi:hypothetical protein